MLRASQGHSGMGQSESKRRKQVGKVEEMMHRLKLLEVSISSDPTLPPCHLDGCYRLSTFLHSFPCFSAKNVTLLRVLTEMQALLAARCLRESMQRVGHSRVRHKRIVEA